MAGRMKKDEKIDTAKVLKRAERAERKAAKDSGTQANGTGASGVSNTRRKPGYTKEKADEVLEHISNGMTVTQACARAGIKRLDFLRWTEVVPELKAEYGVALKRLAGALVDSVLIEAESVKNESESRVLVNKHKVISWASAALDNETWGAKRSYEVGGQISMTHTHSLTQDQRSRIAQAWLMATEGSLPKGKATVLIEANPVYKEIDGEIKLLEVEEVAKIRGVPESAEVREKEERLRRKAEVAVNPDEFRKEASKKSRDTLLARNGKKVLDHLTTIDRIVLKDMSKVKTELEEVK